MMPVVCGIPWNTALSQGICGWEGWRETDPWQHDRAFHANVLGHDFCGGLTPVVLNDMSGGIIWLFQHT